MSKKIVYPWFFYYIFMDKDKRIGYGNIEFSDFFGVSLDYEDINKARSFIGDHIGASVNDVAICNFQRLKLQEK